MSLNDATRSSLNFIKKLPEIADELGHLVQLSINKGWYLNEVFLFTISRDFQEGEDLDCFLQDQILSQWDEFWEMIIRLSPSRDRLLNDAKKAFENQIYGAAIHVYFSQAEGIFYDRFGKSLFSSRGTVAKNEFGGYLTEFIAKDSWGLLLEQCKEGSALRVMFNELYIKGFSLTHTDLMKDTNSIPDELGLITPNRHGVLHGIHKNYGTELNALKCFSLLLFVVYAIYGDQTHEDLSNLL